MKDKKVPVRIILLSFLMSVFLLLSGCTSASVHTGDSVPPVSAEPPAEMMIPQETAEPEPTEKKTSAEQIDDEMNKIVLKLEEAEQKYNIDYQWTIRDYYLYDGVRYEGQWLFAVNDLGEFLDVVILDNTKLTDDPAKVADQDILISYSNTLSGLSFLRKQEGKTYNNKLGVPIVDYGCGFDAYDISEDYTICLAGSNFAMYDVYSIGDYPVFYWDGAWRDMRSRPAPTVAPVNTTVPKSYFHTYYPAETMEEEKEAMLKRLKESGYEYKVEVRDTITIENETYPVEWIYAVNDREEWIDVVYSEDPDLCYLLHSNRDYFADLRREQREKYAALHPGYKDCLFCQQYENPDEWIVQDVFYHGYSYYMCGDGHAMLDAGTSWCVFAYSDEVGDYALHYDRDHIWGVNVRYGGKDGVELIIED